MNIEDIKRAIQPHPDAGHIAAREKRALAAYYGGAALEPYIQELSVREEADKRAWRAAHTLPYWEPFPAEIARTFSEGVYRTQQVRRRTGIEAIDNYLATAYDTWLQNEFAPLALNLGNVFIEFCFPAMPRVPRTMYDQQEMQAWPRPRLLLASKVLNWCEGDDGALRWISRQMRGADGIEYIEILDEAHRWHVDKSGAIIPQLYAPSPGGEAGPVDAVPHGFRGVPVVPVRWQQDYSRNPGCGIAYLDSVIEKSFACLQTIALLVEVMHFTLYPQLAVSEETYALLTKNPRLGPSLPLVEATGKKDESTNPPEPSRYLAKPTTDFLALRDLAYNTLVQSIYRSARVRDRSTDKAQRESGFAKLLDAVPEIAALASVANFYQSIDARAVNLILSAYDPTTKAQAVVTYPVTFDVKGPAELLSQLSAVGDAAEKNGITPPVTGITELLIRAFRAMFPDAEPKLMESIEAQCRAIGEQSEAGRDPFPASKAAQGRKPVAEETNGGTQRTAGDKARHVPALG